MSPAEVLGVSPDATDDEIVWRILLRIQEHAPDRSPEQFERIRDAYEAMRDLRQRLRLRLFAVDPAAPFASLLDGRAPTRRFAGAAPWLDVLRGNASEARLRPPRREGGSGSASLVAVSSCPHSARARRLERPGRKT